MWARQPHMRGGWQPIPFYPAAKLFSRFKTKSPPIPLDAQEVSHPVEIDIPLTPYVALCPIRIARCLMVLASDAARASGQRRPLCCPEFKLARNKSNETLQNSSTLPQSSLDCILLAVACCRRCGCSTMEVDMTIRLFLVSCLALAPSLLFQSDLAIAGQAQSSIRIAQDDSGNAQATPDPAAAPDSGGGDDSKAPAQDPE